MECDLWEATAKGVSAVQLRRWTAQIVSRHTLFVSLALLFLTPLLSGTRPRRASQHGHHAP